MAVASYTNHSNQAITTTRLQRIHPIQAAVPAVHPPAIAAELPRSAQQQSPDGRHGHTIPSARLDHCRRERDGLQLTSAELLKPGCSHQLEHLGLHGLQRVGGLFGLAQGYSGCGPTRRKRCARSTATLVLASPLSTLRRRRCHLRLLRPDGNQAEPLMAPRQQRACHSHNAGGRVPPMAPS